MLAEEDPSITELEAYLHESPSDGTETSLPYMPELPLVDAGFPSNYYYPPCQPIGYPSQNEYISCDFIQRSSETSHSPIGLTANGYEEVHDISEQGIQIGHPEQIQMPVQQSTHGESTSKQSNVALFISGFDKLLPSSLATTEAPAPKKSTQKKVRKTKLKPAVVSEWRCVPCNRMFRMERGLLQHNGSYHSGVKPYSCNVCGKRYHDQQTTLQHQRRHTAVDKPFKCEYCTRQYHHPNDLKRHIDLHHGVARYNCKYCGKAFDRNDHVKDHETSHENGTVKRKRRN
ncbi:zinc finger protein 713-like [Ochlerotatus camptorhynchus]|uniref:zinc finger protein 713-like n=1 Tax=Ochlerotatus camptorhynchus TaxID=644619 RepID=UPI0031D44E07